MSLFEGSRYVPKTREEWEAFAAEMSTWPLSKAVETIADMGEQVDMLYAVRRAAWSDGAIDAR